MRAVNAGEVDGGVIYHYYWFRDQAKTKEISGNTALHYFRNQDPGAFVSMSGGGVLKSSKKKDEAQKFLKFITGKAGQEVLQKGTSFEYPVASGVPANPALVPLADLQAPAVNPSEARRREGHRPDDEGGPAVGGHRRDRADPDHAPARRRRATRGRARRSSVPSRFWSPRRSSRSATSPGRCVVDRTGQGLRTRRAGRGSANCWSTPSAWSWSRCRSASCSASAPHGWWSAPTAAAATLWRPLLVAPLAVPAFVNSYALGRRRARRCTASARAC